LLGDECDICKSVLQCSYELIRKTWKRWSSHCLRAALGGFVFSCVELGTNVFLKMVGGKSNNDKGSEELGRKRGICRKYRWCERHMREQLTG